MDNGLVIVPAGAGAGKTHRIKSQLSDWVRRGIVRPERILAVTFTEAAAAELRERIRTSLLDEGMVSEALAVEQAYVSTIHGLGLRLLSEHALAAGSSPGPRPLGDAERDLLIRQALAHAKALDPIKAEPERFGYKDNRRQDQTAEDSLRGRVLAMIDLLRGLGDKGHDVGLIGPALARLDAVHGEVLSDATPLRAALLSAIQAMVMAFPDGGMATITAKSPLAALEKDLGLFRRIMRDPGLLDRDWALWQSLRGLFVSNSKSKTPAGYDDLAVAIMEAADMLPRHPGPLADAKLHLSCLIACAQEVMSAYEARKKSLGLIDFADMITGAERLLRTHPDVLQAVLDEIDCVIIDEFQDTNPVQFALLWQLGLRAPRTLLVGDVKQSIMGFQGADPRLSLALAAANPGAVQPLDRNWRSTPAVMQFVNAMGAGLFGDGYTALTPQRAPVAGPALELLRMGKSRRVRKGSKPPAHAAERIARILIDQEVITDRHDGTSRAARPSDIAVLVGKHDTAAKYALELRARGVPVRISESGWSASPAVIAARAALSFAANPADIQSALILRTLGPDPLDLNGALTAQLDGRLLDDPILMGLATLAPQMSMAPVSVALDMVLGVAGLRDWVDSLPDDGQSRADLLRLEGEAVAFQTAHRDLKAASGFHGETAKVFLGWLDARMDERDFDRRPDPAGDTAEAVEIVTWHASKGREWPITLVAEFDKDIAERPGTTSVRFEALERIDDMASVLASARLIHTPDFAAPEIKARFIEDRRDDFEATARNLLYVALTRARDRLVLEWPDFLAPRPEDAPQATTLFHVFEDGCHPEISGSLLALGDVECPAVIMAMSEEADFSEHAARAAAGVVRFGKAFPMAPVVLSPWRIQPSQGRRKGPAPATRSSTLGQPWPAGGNDAARGTALHLALRTFLIRPDLATALAGITGFDQPMLDRIRDRAMALKEWLVEQGYNDLRAEVNIGGQSDDGAEIQGSVDLLAIGPAGCLLIDHKSGGTGTGFGPYWPQLCAYADLIARDMPDHPLNGVAIFWIDHGQIEWTNEMAAMSSIAC